ncbi:MAG: alcohol dehydrogenase catalytic domain-containing protein [Sedimentisphaerales bacterium]|nr:alcohol dehydrogenase catalytic domain-containing protein [Sedimentisphaerales bacterium]
MKAQVLTGIRQMKMVQVEPPAIRKDTDVLLKIDMVGVCGSDVHYYETGRIGSQVVSYPFRVGHECAATVVEVGSAVTRVKPGDMVVIEPAVVCHECDQCLAGRENTCRKLKFLGCPGQLEGCLCEYLVMPQECCFPTHGKLTPQQAVMCEPFAIGVYSVQQSGIQAGQCAAILGAGPIGLSCLAAARARDVQTVFMTDKIDARVEVARKAQATWAGNPDTEDIVAVIQKQQPGGIDVVYECCGQQEAIDQALELLKPGGTLMLVGIPRQDRISFQIDQLRRKEITVINVRRQNDCPQKAIDLVASGRADVDFMVTHHFSFDRSKEAFDLVASYADGVVKAMIHL